MRAGRLDAVHDRHLHVHEHDVGAQRAGQPHRLGAVAGLADDLEVVLDREDEREAGPHELLVVDEQHASVGSAHEVVLGQRHAAPGPGSRRSTRGPDLDLAAHASAARSRTPSRPRPVPDVPERGRPSSSTSTSA